MLLIEGCVREKYNNMLDNQWQTSYKYAKKGENILKLNNHYSQQRVAFVIHANFQAVAKKVQGCRLNDNKSYTKAYQTHEDCGYGYKVVCCYDDKYSKPVKVCRGKNAVYRFLGEMLKEGEHCRRSLRQSSINHLL